MFQTTNQILMTDSTNHGDIMRSYEMSLMYDQQSKDPWFLKKNGDTKMHQFHSNPVCLEMIF
jgi:hypothetical protein